MLLLVGLGNPGPNNLNKSLDSKVAKEMAKKIAADAKMHRKAREI